MIIYNVPVSGRCLQIILGRTSQGRVGPVWLLWESETEIDALYLFIVFQDWKIFQIESAKTNIYEILTLSPLYEASPCPKPSIPRNDDGVRVFNLNLRPVTPGCLWLDVPTESVQPMIKWPDNADGSDNHPWQNIIDCTPLSLYRVNLSVSNANIPKDQRTKSHSHTPWSPLRRLFPWSSQKRHSSILILAGCLYNLS